jgi:hypothetical protein
MVHLLKIWEKRQSASFLSLLTPPPPPPLLQHRLTTTNNNNNINNSIQSNSIYLCAKLNSPEANYKVSTVKNMGRVRSKKVSQNNNILIKVINYKIIIII